MSSVTFQNLNLVSGVLLVSFLLCISLALTYVEYLKKGKSSLTFLQFLIVLLPLLLLANVILSAFTSNLLVTTLAYLFFFLLLLTIWRKYSKFKCVNTEKIDEIDGIPILLCYNTNRIYNAWFNPRRKEIVITKDLFDVLSEKERNAVIYHEIGHSKNKFWLVITAIMQGLWLMLASYILAITQLIIFSNTNIPSKISLFLTFVALLPMYAISFMISSWINEHEADVYATQIVEFKSTTMALVKLHIYNSLREYGPFLEGVEFSEDFVVDEISL